MLSGISPTPPVIYAAPNWVAQSTPGYGGAGDRRLHRAKTRILLLEDDPANEMVMQSFLGITGFKPATVARTLAEATVFIDAIIEGDFDLAIFDVMLPDGESGELAFRVRSACDTPLFAYTARCSARDRRMLIGQGFDLVLPKPLDLKIFSECIDRYVD